MSQNDFDVVVIGAGPGGYVAAIRSAQLGLKTAIVEREHMGGICLNWGCIPTKAMLRSAEIFHLMHRANEFGLTAEQISFDLDAVIKRSRGISKQLNQGVTHLLKKNKVKSFIGEATILKKGKIKVSKDKKSEELLTDNIIIASGARARELPGLEADGEVVWTYKHALTPARMPKKLLVIGSGAIGIEFASFYNTLGADTTVIELVDRILPAEDAEVASFAHKQFLKQGMKILTRASVKKNELKNNIANIQIEHDGKIITEQFDTVISAVGIVGNIEELGLDKLPIKTEKSHIKTDSKCKFRQLIDILAVDFPGEEDRFKIYYLLLSHENNIRIKIVSQIQIDSKVPSITKIYPSANWMEREVFDMYGIKFKNHPDLRRILTDYNFKGFPLRKDFPLTGFNEVRYSEKDKKVIYEPVKLEQNYRNFDFSSPWEGTKYIKEAKEKVKND